MNKLLSIFMDEYPENVLKPLRRSVLKAELESITPKSLSKKSDPELAFWQSEFKQNSPQYRMAEQEWQRRLIISQLHGVRFAAYLGILGTLLGAIVGHVLTRWW